MSKQILRDATYSIHKLIEKSTQLSFATRHDYKQILSYSLTELYKMGVQLPSIQNIKQKHIKRLLDQWQIQKLSNGTVKNRLSAIRFALKALGKTDMLPDTNKALSVGERKVKPTFNRAVLNLPLEKINNPYVAYSLRLQQCFGLRRQEAIKFIVSHADKEHYLDIKGSWTKGGVPRKVPITTVEQRQLLNELHCYCKRGQALIPADKSYRQQLNSYVSQTRHAGLKNLHGLRHAYAQTRYRVLTDKLTNGNGWNAPINGGLPRGKLSPFQKGIDHQVRELISNELGHRRVEISASYLA